MHTYSTHMGQRLMKEPALEYAKSGANPSLSKIEYVRAILQRAEEPISRNALLAVLAKWGHSTNRPSLNAILEFFGDNGMVVEGSKGLIWVPEAPPQLLEVIRTGYRL